MVAKKNGTGYPRPVDGSCRSGHRRNYHSFRRPLPPARWEILSGSKENVLGRPRAGLPAGSKFGNIALADCWESAMPLRLAPRAALFARCATGWLAGWAKTGTFAPDRGPHRPSGVNYAAEAGADRASSPAAVRDNTKRMAQDAPTRAAWSSQNCVPGRRSTRPPSQPTRLLARKRCRR